MKKTLLLIIAFCMVQVASAQNIPNRGFESWAVDTLFENNVSWYTIYDDQPLLGVDVLHKSTDAQDGNFSIYLSNDTINGDSLFGYVVQGRLADGPNSDSLPYTSDIDSITGWYKYDMGAGDSAVLLVFQYSDVDTISDVFTIGGTQNSWTRFSFPLQAFTDTLEQIFIGMVSSDPDIVGTSVFHPDSWIMFDNIQFTHASTTPAALPDYSFENWYVETYEDAEGWFSLNQFSTIVGDEISVEKTTDAAKGNYAMKITSQYSQIFDDTAGIALNGQIGDVLPGGFAFDEIPYTISGFYKYNPATSNDTALIAVFLSKWDPIGDSTQNILENYFYLEPQSTYTAFSFDIDTAGLAIGDFDSVNVIMTSSIYSFDGGAPIGSELFIDELWLDSKCAFADTTELFDEDSATVYSSDVPGYYQIDDVWNTYLWSDADSTTSNVIALFFENESGMYTLMVTDADGCEVVDGIYFTVINYPWSIEEGKRVQVSIYPNPSIDIINIDFRKIESSLQKEISISDLSGKQIMRTFVTGQNEVLNINELPSGVYLMNIRIGEELTTVKVVKK